MKYQRENDQIITPAFSIEYGNGRLKLMKLDVIPISFIPIYRLLKEDYVFTNELQNDSCLIIPESPDLCERLSAARPKSPTIYVDPRISSRNQSLLTVGIRLMDDNSIEHHYRPIARIISSSDKASVLIINSTKWDNRSLQETLIEHGKHYSVALPEILEEKILPSYHDPDRWKK